MFDIQLFHYVCAASLVRSCYLCYLYQIYPKQTDLLLQQNM